MVPFFEKVIDALNSRDIPYMLSGSLAMSLFTVPRSTRDFDFVIHLRPADVDGFVNEFKEGYYCDKDSIQEAVATRSMFNIIDHASGFKADFVILKDEAFRQHEFSRRMKMDFFGRTIYTVTAEDLLISKVIWIQDFESAIQKEDLRNLCLIEGLDWKYIKDWVAKLKLNTFAILPE